jgi:predicted nucleotidyltransferase
MTREVLFRAVKANLTESFGERLHSVILFGSEARGTAGPIATSTCWSSSKAAS